VIAGPWQMGKVDQGFVSLWAARHLWGSQLSYTGFGGAGLQVRDVLHVQDLCDLVDRQIDRVDEWSGAVLNVGGGVAGSVSLKELTRFCQFRSGRQLAFTSVATTAPADIPYYVSDNARVTAVCGWAPQRSVEALLDDVFAWLRTEEPRLRPILGA
jgi:CDP-paratose 2-epimerase